MTFVPRKVQPVRAPYEFAVQSVENSESGPNRPLSQTYHTITLESPEFGGIDGRVPSMKTPTRRVSVGVHTSSSSLNILRLLLFL